MGSHIAMVRALLVLVMSLLCWTALPDAIAGEVSDAPVRQADGLHHYDSSFYRQPPPPKCMSAHLVASWAPPALCGRHRLL